LTRRGGEGHGSPRTLSLVTFATVFALGTGLRLGDRATAIVRAREAALG